MKLEWYFKYYGKNAKCVIRHRLFLDKKVKSVKNTKFTKEQLEQILESLKK